MNNTEKISTPSLRNMLNIIKILDSPKESDNSPTHALTTYSRNKAFLQEELLRKLAYEVICLMANNEHATNARNESHLLAELIMRGANRKKTIPEIAKSMGTSTSTLTRRFKQKFNLSINQWTINMRLEQAHFLITHSDKSIKEIAYESGFCNSSYMIKCYKRKYGHTPTEDATRIKQSQENSNLEYKSEGLLPSATEFA